MSWLKNTFSTRVANTLAANGHTDEREFRAWLGSSEGGWNGLRLIPGIGRKSTNEIMEWARAASPAKPLRSTSQRGFNRVDFTDRYQASCSLQESSLGTEAAVWLGINDAAPQQFVKDEGWKSFPIPDDVMLTTRMHLTQEMAAWLIEELRYFVNTGKVRAPA